MDQETPQRGQSALAIVVIFSSKELTPPSERGGLSPFRASQHLYSGSCSGALSVLRRLYGHRYGILLAIVPSSGQEGVSVVAKRGVIATGAGGDSPRR